MTDNKQAESGMQRGLRIASMALTVLGPVINNAADRLGDRLESGRRAQKVTVDVEEVPVSPVTDVAVVEPEDVVATKPSLSGALLELKDRPYSQELLKRGELLVAELEELVERGSKLSQNLVTRSNEVTRELADRGSKASLELVKRSEEARKELRKRGKKLNKQLNKRSRKVAKELRKRSEKVSKELSRRSQQASRQISERSGTFWTIFGFSVGLTAAGVAAYVLIRQRVKQQQQLEEEQSFQVSQNGYLNTAPPISQGSGPIRSAAQPEPIIQKPLTQGSVIEESVPAVAVAEQASKTPAEPSAPVDATFIGVVTTKRYYPVSTPLDQLASSENGKVDVIYFISEEEAKVQGYTSGV
jgi:hypothetical protein